MRRIVIAAGIAAATAAAIAARAQIPGLPGGGGPGGRPGMSQPADELDRTPPAEKPDAAATKAYKLGEKTLQKGKDYEAEAAKATSADKRADELEKASEQYYRALDLFTAALDGRPEMFEAWNAVGYAHLRLGAFRESVDDYDHALKYKPDLEEAILYRAVAYLALDRLDDAEIAYMDLFNHQRDLADQLMKAMHKWLAEHREDAKGMRPAQIDAFDAWLQQRDQLAKQAAS
jgi:tetratricopeptide (TPR) repeat protein